ncbi:MAG: diguanylate cyclase [Thermoanaerobaculia bacterium]
MNAPETTCPSSGPGYDLARHSVGAVESPPAEIGPPRRYGRILVIDDSRVTRRYLEAILLRSGVCETVELASSVRSGMQLVQESGVDLVVCDLNMPELDGLAFLELLGKEQGAEETPVIMLTGEESLESKVRCLESGASDYLVKPFADEELVARTRIHLQIKALQDELRIKNEQLRRLACLDSLTGVPNRYHFLERLEAELSRCSRQGLPLSLAMIDIDHFKRVNDDHGHLCGDQTLRRVAEMLEQGLRDYDILARYGGEEFCAAFIDTSPEAALGVAERCRLRVAQQPVAYEGHELEITVSIGVASSTEPTSGMSTELISRADEALYMAKHRGRNQVVLAPPLATSR